MESSEEWSSGRRRRFGSVGVQRGLHCGYGDFDLIVVRPSGGQLLEEQVRRAD